MFSHGKITFNRLFVAHTLKLFSFHSKIDTWIKPKVLQRGNGEGETIHVIKSVLTEKLVDYRKNEIVKIFKSVPGCHVDFRSSFNGKREHCYKIPRNAVEQEILQTIDGCKC